MVTGKEIIIGVFVMSAVFILASMPVSADAAVIPANSYKSWNASLNSGDTWYFNVQASDGVDVLVMDNDNYQIFTSGGTPFTYTDYSYNSMSQVSFTIDDITGDIWIVVLSNNLLLDQTINYENTITRYDGSGDDGGEETPGFTFPIVFTAVIIGIGIIRIKNRRR